MKQFNLAILLAALVSMVSTKALAYDVAVENEDGITIYYNYINDGTEFEVTFNSYSESYSGDVKIPETVTIQNRTRKVTSIGESAFQYCSGLTSVTIPASVTSISNAFTACDSLKKVIVKDLAAWCGISFDISGNPLDYAQHLYSDEDTEITDLIIPDGVTSIGRLAFRNCTGLTSVTIPASVTSIGSSAFYNCSGLKKVIVKDLAAWCGISFDVYGNPLDYAQHLYSDEDTEITDLIIPDGVTSIGMYAFNRCVALTSVTIPGSVTSIGGYAFLYCTGLTSVIIPDGVTRIGGGAFSGCTGLTSVTIPASVTSIGYEAFDYCIGLKKVIVKDLAAWCGISFDGFTNNNGRGNGNPLYYAQHLYIDEDTEITDLVIPDGVTSIGHRAFEHCSGLTSVTIPDGVTSIGYGAFQNCTGLTSVTIPGSVTSISYYAFYGCFNLADLVSLIQEPFMVRYFVSDIVYSYGTLYVPQGTIEKYKATDDWRQFVRIEEGMPASIKLPNSAASNATEVQRYTIGGESINSPQHGINVVKMSDGTAKKVIVK